MNKTRKLPALLLCVALVMSLLPAPARAANAVLSPQNLTVDGKPIECEKYNIGGSNYFKLRDLAYVLSGTVSQFAVGYDEASATVSITTGAAYTPNGTELTAGADNSATAQRSAQTILIDGAARGDLTAYNIGGSNFFQLRELGAALGFAVEYDAATNTAVVRSAAAATMDEELRKAQAIGFLPAAWQGDLNGTVTMAEFAAMLDTVVNAAAPNRDADWKNLSATFRDAGDAMTRGAGAMALFDCALALGIDTEGCETNDIWLDSEGANFWAGMSLDNARFPNMQDTYSPSGALGADWMWMMMNSIRQNAGWFATRYSYGNGKNYLEYDKTTYSMRWGDPFTREEAARAAERLYETAAYCLMLVPAAQAVSGVTDETLRLAQNMRPATYDSLPDWKGYHVPSAVSGFPSGESGYCYDREQVERIADMGFDFVRVPLNLENVFNVDGSTVMVRAHFVASMDELVNWCAARGIHVCFDIHDAPGFHTGGSAGDITIFENTAQQELFVQFWGWMAEHYQNVPSSLLSFNLLNEPNGAQEVSDAVYSALMLKAIERIRAYTPDRLIFVDMLGGFCHIPVEGLAAARVAQTIHPYFLRPGAQEWPSNSINGFVARNNGELTINGSFPAGTTITTQIEMAHGVSTLTWAAGSANTQSFSIGGEAVGEGGCTEIFEQGTNGENRRYEKKEWSVTLTQDCNRLTLRQEGNGNWYIVQSITIQTPSKTLHIAKNETFVPSDKVPELTIAADGTIRATDPDAFLVMDKAAMDALFREYAAFSARTGETLMIQEFGADAVILGQAARGFVDDLLSLAEQYNIPWCSYCHEFGLWMNEKWIDRQTRQGRQVLRNGADFENVGNGWVIDRDMEKIFRKHL